jgi:hypothetical protein
MYLKTTEPLYKPQIACGLVRRAGKAQQHKLFYLAAATARVITNIPTFSGCQILN